MRNFTPKQISLAHKYLDLIELHLSELKRRVEIDNLDLFLMGLDLLLLLTIQAQGEVDLAQTQQGGENA